MTWGTTPVPVRRRAHFGTSTSALWLISVSARSARPVARRAVMLRSYPTRVSRGSQMQRQQQIGGAGARRRLGNRQTQPVAPAFSLSSHQQLHLVIRFNSRRAKGVPRLRWSGAAPASRIISSILKQRRGLADVWSLRYWLTFSALGPATPPRSDFRRVASAQVGKPLYSISGMLAFDY